MSDKSLGIKINSSAAGEKTELNAVTNALQSVTDKLKSAGYAVSNIKKIQDATGNYRKVVVTAKKDTETLKTTINSLGKTTGIQTITKQATTAKSALSQMFSFGKIYAFWNMTKRLRDGIKDMLVSSIDFIETTNKFEVSMGRMEESGYKFINTVSERFGIAREELMNYQSTYNNIMKSLSGITAETAYKISESITEMAIDYASLYNVSTEESMTKFQSALVGSVRPIRSESGYDITETTIGQKAKELGVETPVRQLTQMEKRLLRIMVLMDQMRATGAMGDFARTIEQPANQLKVLQNQLKELGVWLGNVFLGTLGKILPYVNGFVMVLKELAKMLAIFVGYDNVGSIADPLQDADDSTANVAGNLGSAAKSAKELKKTLMGFDVLNVITTPSKSSGGGGSDVGTIDPKILGALEDYDNLMDNVRMKATEIRDKIMEWLGFTKEVDEKTGEVTWKLGRGYTNLEKIRDILIVIVGASILLKIVSLIALVTKGIGSAKALLVGTKVAATTATAATATATTGIVAKTSAALSGIALKIGSFFSTVIGPISSFLTGIFGTGLAGAGTFLAGIVAPITALGWGIWQVNQNALDTEKSLDVFDSSISEATENAVKPFLTSMQELGTTIQGINFKDTVTAEDVTNVKTQVEAITSTVVDTAKTNYEKLEDILNDTELFPDEKKRKEYLEDAKTFFEGEKNLAEGYRDKINKIYEKAHKENRNLTKDEYDQIELLTYQMTETGIQTLSKSQKEALKIKAKFNENYLDLEMEQIADAIKNAKTLKDKTLQEAKEEYEGKIAYAEELKETLPNFTDEMYNEMITSAEEAYNKQVEDAKKSYDDIVSAAQTKYPEVTKVIDLETGEMKTYWQLFGDYVKGVFDKTEKNAETSATNAYDIIDKKMNLLSVDLSKKNPTMNIKVKTPSVSDIQSKYNNKSISLTGNLKINSVLANKSGSKDYMSTHNFLNSLGLNIRGYATGGFPDVGQMFMAREAGPELVGTIGNKSAVVNNDQIVEAVSQGVAQAVSSVMGSNGGSYHLYIDGQEITDVVSRRMSRMANITGGGYVYGQ